MVREFRCLTVRGRRMSTEPTCRKCGHPFKKGQQAWGSHESPEAGWEHLFDDCPAVPSPTPPTTNNEVGIKISKRLWGMEQFPAASMDDCMAAAKVIMAIPEVAAAFAVKAAVDAEPLYVLRSNRDEELTYGNAHNNLLRRLKAVAS
jgi:hypothetical protein